MEKERSGSEKYKCLFADPEYQAFICKWCEINTGLKIVFNEDSDEVFVDYNSQKLTVPQFVKEENLKSFLKNLREELIGEEVLDEVNKTKGKVFDIISEPEKELNSIFFEKGTQELKTKIKDRLIDEEYRAMILRECDIDLYQEQQTLYETLKIEDKKLQLEEARVSKSIEEISLLEDEIVLEIQTAISKFPYKYNSSEAQKILETMNLNCASSAWLGSSMLEELGIDHLQVDVPGHAVTLVITSDKKVHWRDFTPIVGVLRPIYGMAFNEELRESNIDESSSSKLRDIVEFLDSDEDSIVVKTKNFQQACNGKITIYKPNIGLMAQSLNNAGNNIYVQENDEKLALSFYKQTTKIAPNFSDSYNNMGKVLENDDSDAALDNYLTAIKLDNDFTHAYLGAANIYFDKGEFKKSRSLYKKLCSLRCISKTTRNDAKERIKEIEQILRFINPQN